LIISRKLAALVFLSASATIFPLWADDGIQKQAADILAAAKVQGGLVIHVGCGDGRLTCALHLNDSYTVQGLETDPTKVDAARAYIRAQGLDGKVTVDFWDGAGLPYIDNLVNLLVSDDSQQIAPEEIMRVLVPEGVACLYRDGTWTQTVKPRPEDIDEWTHYLRDSTNNAVAQDSVVGPPKHFQWIASPRWLRHHDHMSGFSAMVSAKGRLFYIVDLGPRWSIQMPPKWTLIARDAFNGTLLWQKPINKWHAHLWPLKKGPADLMRRLVAEGDTLYVTLGVGQGIVALDAATGRELRSYQGSQGTEEVIVADGILISLVNPRGDAYASLPRENVDVLRKAGRSWNWDERPRNMVAFDAKTGEVLWSRKTRVAPVSLASDLQRVYFHDGQRIVCLDAMSGEEIWSSQPIPRWKPMHVLFGPSLVVYQDVVLFAGGEKMDPLHGGKDTMTALCAKTGEVLWKAPHPQSGYASAEDLLVIDGLVWCGETTNRNNTGTFTGRDPHTGEVVREFPGDDWPHMPHHRCYRAKATCNYILTSRTGIEFVDLETEHWAAHHWVRGACNYGILPCNGLVYAPPHSCACYPVAKLNGLNVLAPARDGDAANLATPDAARLQKGPAYSTSEDAAATGGDAEEWPTFRHDGQRSGTTNARVPTDLSRIWQTSLGGRLSALSVAEGTVFVAAIDHHTVYAIKADSGKKIWSFTAGGRVDSPPTIWQGRVLFGSADGHVYCLRAADGEMIWRYQAAPRKERMIAFDQLESVWPVHGAVLVRDGVAYLTAGRAMWLDGGLRFLRLDARRGQKLSETVLDDRYPDSNENLQQNIRWPNLPVALPDILSCDGDYVYMRSQPFDLQGDRTEVLTSRDYREQRGPTAHLFSPTGFLDDSWWHRSYWMYGKSFIGGAGGWYLAGYQAPTGRILGFDADSVYGFGRAPMRLGGTPNTYHLFACARPTEVVDPNPNAPSRRRGASVYGEVRPTRLKYQWSEAVPLLVRALVGTADSLVIAGPPGITDESPLYYNYATPEMQEAMADATEAFAGKKGALVMLVSKEDGQRQAAYRLDSAPVFDGVVATAGHLFMSTLDGQVICLGDGRGTPLVSVPEAKPGPVPAPSSGFLPTKSHPDFQFLANVQIQSSDIGYRVTTMPQGLGQALQQLSEPISKRAEFTLRVRPRPDAPTADTPGNGFFAFGDGPEDKHLVKCGFRISGQRLYIVQGELTGGKSVGTPITIKAKEVTDMKVTVDLQQQTVSVTMLGETLEAPLERKLETIRWVGYVISSVPADFSPVEITRP
jgi:outer membrane protein assembly factor BamB